MKRLFLFSLLACLFSCEAELKVTGEDVPEAVRSAFAAKYPTADELEWEVEKNDGRLVYEACFKTGGKKKEAEFRSDGTFIKEE
jgi:hypothetical protein